MSSMKITTTLGGRAVAKAESMTAKSIESFFMGYGLGSNGDVPGLQGNGHRTCGTCANDGDLD